MDRLHFILIVLGAMGLLLGFCGVCACMLSSRISREEEGVCRKG